MKSLIILSLCALVAVGCAHSEKKEIRKQAEQSTVTDPKALGGTIHEAIHSSKNLSDEQKQKLEGIIAANKKLAEELSAESYKFRGILIQELLSEKRDASKIRLLKKDIRRIEKAKLKNTFDTVEKISEVVSKYPGSQEFSAHLINIERPNR